MYVASVESYGTQLGIGFTTLFQAAPSAPFDAPTIWRSTSNTVGFVALEWIAAAIVRAIMIPLTVDCDESCCVPIAIFATSGTRPFTPPEIESAAKLDSLKVSAGKVSGANKVESVIAPWSRSADIAAAGASFTEA